MHPRFTFTFARATVLMLLVGLMNVACSNETAKHRHAANGDRFLAAGKPKAAIIEFRNAVAIDGNWGEARYKLAEAYAANGDSEHAYRQYIRAADLMPDRSDVQLTASTYLLLAGQFEDAKTRVQQLLAKEPRNIDAQILLGNALAGLRDLAGAITQINEAIELDPLRSQLYANLALIRVALGQREEAKAAFEKAVQTDEESVPAHLALANFQWSVGDRSAAERSLQRAFDLDGANVLTNRALATFYGASGRAGEAERHLKLAAEGTKGPSGQFVLADYYMSMGRRDDARAVLRPLTARAAVAGAAEARLAGITYGVGQTAEAHAMLDKVLVRDPEDTFALLLKARWLLTEGRLEEALERVKLVVTLAPRMIAAHYIRGLVEAKSHRTSDAIKSFTEVLRLNAHAAAAQVQLARVFLVRNAIDSAVLYAEEALRNAPGNLEARLLLIRSWMARGDAQLAAAELKALGQQAPTSAGVHALEGSRRMLMHDPVAARVQFAEALRLDGSSMEALTGITTIDVVQNNVRLARARIEALLPSRANDPEMLLLAAKVFVADNDLTGAEKLLRKAIDLDPLDIEPYSLVGRIYAEQHKLDAVRAEFEEITRREPRNIAARMMIAMILHAQGDLAGAKTRYDEIVKMEPRAVLAANNLAQIYADEGENLILAQEIAEAAAEQAPGHAAIHDTLGWVYYKRQLHGKAVGRFQQSVAIEPDNAVYHYHLGLAYAKSGEPRRARDAFRTALKLNPLLTDAQQALGSFDN